MAYSDGIRTGREDRISSLYQVDPVFYRKILSRNSFGDSSDRLTVYRMPGTVPFTWEMQPGEPRDSREINERVSPIKLPPAVRGLNMPRPSLPPSRTKAFLLKKLKKAEDVKNIQLFKRLSRTIHGLTQQSSKVTFKEYLMKNVRKLKHNRLIHLGKKSECKSSKEARGDFDDYDTNESDGYFEFFYSANGDFTSSSTNSSSTPSSTASSSFSFSTATKLPKISNFFDLSKRVEKWKKYNMKQT